ncbi:hypothetical protein PAE0827 [Pyrobaculum aerophilum str. IM2]|uniref:Uncharacterized protein n=2 Tax=Pyrobaculum aerophilum TaxID=13773 RepID=Q8ZYD4_PYRAE|nr:MULTISPECIES: hypothetical protein [Pyrobaculum]AAL63059.1 hypothetical protein PAE0827 [Pyrobaculum aerophilum str. IM2]HII48173.1 hypothetical protein [Pyrobaculum aerophilum]
MARSVLLLIAVGIALVAVYVVMPSISKPPELATATPPPPVQTTQKPAETTTTPPTTSTAAAPQTVTSQVTAKAPEPVYLPKIEAEIIAPAVLNTTRLPAEIKFTVIIKNTGNGTGSVTVGGTRYVLAPGQEIRINSTALASAAGSYSLEAVVNGTRLEKTVKVFYYAPRLEALPVVINVTELPANVTIKVMVRNTGNLTARVKDVEIRPGEERVINASLTVEAAGNYVVDVDGVAVPVKVNYYAPSFQWKVGGPGEVEAIPGESYSAWLWVKNTGNATAKLLIDGREATLPPGGELNITKQVTVRAAGTYAVEFHIAGGLNATVKYVIRAKIVAIRVQYVIWAPQLRRSWPAPNSTETTSISTPNKTVVLSWGYIIETNATSRTVVLVVQDADGVYYYTLKPGTSAGKNFTTTVQAPGEKMLEIRVNSTAYRLGISLQITPPKVTIKDISKISFKDDRPLRGVKITCRAGSVSADILLDILSISGTLTYTATGRSISGSITVAAAGGTYTGDYSGKIEGNGGQMSVNVIGRNIYVEFTVSPLAINRVLVDGVPYSCNVPIQLIPTILYSGKPTAVDEPATQYVYRLITVFAKSDSDKPQSVVWNGEYVEVIDKGGDAIRVYFKDGAVRVEGALSATLVIS